MFARVVFNNVSRLHITRGLEVPDIRRNNGSRGNIDMPMLDELEILGCGAVELQPFLQALSAPMLESINISTINADAFRIGPTFPRPQSLCGTTVPRIYQTVSHVSIPLGLSTLQIGAENPLLLFRNARTIALTFVYSVAKCRNLEEILIEMLLDLVSDELPLRNLNRLDFVDDSVDWSVKPGAATKIFGTVSALRAEAGMPRLSGAFYRAARRGTPRESIWTLE